MGPPIIPVHLIPPHSCKVDPRAVFQCSGARSSKSCWNRRFRLYRLMIPPENLPCHASQSTCMLLARVGNKSGQKSPE